MRQKDEQISRLEKKMEEMMIALTTLHSLPQSPQVQPVEVNQPEVVQRIENKKSNTDVSEDSQHAKKETVATTVQEKDLKQMVEQQVKEALAQSKGGASNLKGRPYPEEFDKVFD